MPYPPRPTMLDLLLTDIPDLVALGQLEQHVVDFGLAPGGVVLALVWSVEGFYVFA